MDKIVHNVQNQTSGAVVTYLNNQRLQDFLQKTAVIDIRSEGAARKMSVLVRDVNHLLETNRGYDTGIHGFIGENVQVSTQNAEAIMLGKAPLYRLVDDNGAVDYWKGTIPVQQKARISDGACGLTAIQEHAAKYPEFIEAGGIYQIPKDLYETYCKFANMPAEIALKLRKDDLRQWRLIHNIRIAAPDIKVEPMAVTYQEIQAANVSDTIQREQDKLARMERAQRNAAKRSCSPTVAEGVRVTVFSAVLEGAVNTGISFVQHVQKKGAEQLELSDWEEIASDGAKGTALGTVRGATVYAVTNITKISAPIATAGVTVVVSVAGDSKKWIYDEITTSEFASKTLGHTVDAGVSAASAMLGEVIIPIPIVGALVGSIVGSSIVCLIRSDATQQRLRDFFFY